MPCVVQIILPHAWTYSERYAFHSVNSNPNCEPPPISDAEFFSGDLTLDIWTNAVQRVVDWHDSDFQMSACMLARTTWAIMMVDNLTSNRRESTYPGSVPRTSASHSHPALLQGPDKQKEATNLIALLYSLPAAVVGAETGRLLTTLSTIQGHRMATSSDDGPNIRVTFRTG